MKEESRHYLVMYDMEGLLVTYTGEAPIEIYNTRVDEVKSREESRLIFKEYGLNEAKKILASRALNTLNSRPLEEVQGELEELLEELGEGE